MIYSKVFGSCQSGSRDLETPETTRSSVLFDRKLGSGENIFPCNRSNRKSEVGGSERSARNREIVSFRVVRACARLAMPSQFPGQTVKKKKKKKCLSLFPLSPMAFPFSLRGWLFPFPTPLPPTSYPTLIGFIGIDIYIYIYTQRRIRLPSSSPATVLGEGGQPMNSN